MTTAFTVRHATITGPLDSPIADVAHDTHVRGAATIKATTYHGAGDNRRATLALSDDTGATVAAVIDADHLWRMPDFVLALGSRIEFGGHVRRFPGVPNLVTIAIYGIAPVTAAA